MSLEIEERDREGIAILACKGKLSAGSGSETFRSRTRALVDEGKCNIILNFEHVDHIDSDGLGQLVSLDQDVQNSGGKVKLVELNEKHLELLVITKLDTTFEKFGDEQDAVNSFFPNRQVTSFDLLKFVHDIEEEEEKK